MKFISFQVGDIVMMKKPHPCGSQNWEVLQLGTDMRVKCCGCGHMVLMPRPKIPEGGKKNTEIVILKMKGNSILERERRPRIKKFRIVLDKSFQR